jgi:hypothetical protein
LPHYWTKDDFWAELEALGEPLVREHLRIDYWGGPGIAGTRRPLVEEWLCSKEEAHSEASQSQQAEAASRAASAAERAAAAADGQAMAAQRASTRATVALIIAIISAAASSVPYIITFTKYFMLF